LFGAEDSDTVYGEEGDDIIDARLFDTLGSSDRSIGGEGTDLISADDDRNPPSKDVVDGGAGNDEIFAQDGNKDAINCGDGQDIAHIDGGGIGRVRNCESTLRQEAK
jgi:RTX calcium-binding nonapeptide repeat (4 copies)